MSFNTIKRFEPQNEKRTTRDQLITTEDLFHFKQELLAELKTILQPKQQVQTKKWLKSWEVKEMLGISPGTLQNMRINGTLPHTKIGGLIFYDQEDILQLMQPITKKPIRNF